MSYNNSNLMRINENKSSDIEAIVKKYEEELEKIYEKQSRGDYTWRGILISFIRDVEVLNKRPSAVYRGD